MREGSSINTYSGRLAVAGVSVAMLQQQDSPAILLQDVLFVPQAPHPIGPISVGVEQDKGAELRGAGTDMHLQLVNGQVIKGSRANYPPHISPLFYVHCRLPTPAELITARATAARQLEREWNQPDGGIRAQRLLKLRQQYTTKQIEALKPAVARADCVANEPGVAAMLTLEEPLLKVKVELERAAAHGRKCKWDGTSDGERASSSAAAPV